MSSTTNTTIWDHSNETLDREELAQLQLERLQASLFRAYRNVAFYRKRFDAHGAWRRRISSRWTDLRTLPFTTQEDLQRGYPYDMLAVPLREVVRLHSSSWAAGRPTVCAYTRNDLRHWQDSVARLLTAGGVTRDDVVQIFFAHGMLTRGLGFHGGAERIGASVIPSSPGGIEQQVAIMQDFKTTAIVGTSSEAAHLAEMVAEHGMDARRLSLRVGLFGSEPWSESSRAHIERALGITALDNYGLSEVGGPGIAGECRHKCGLHLAEDHFFAEMVDPETGEPVPEGEEGELVLTTLTKEALPLIRFRTRDLTRLNTRPCECGRTLARMARIFSRTDDLLIVNGLKLYPAQVEEILADVEGAKPNFHIVLTRKAGEDEMEIFVELLSGLSADSVGKILAVEQRILERFQSTAGLSPKIRVVESQTIARLAEGNASRVTDRRE